MKQLFQLVNKKIRQWYYFQELKELSLVFGIGFCIWVAFTYGKQILHFLGTEKGLMCLLFLIAAWVLAIVIKIYYRIIVIKYHEKDTHIEMLKNISQNK